MRISDWSSDVCSSDLALMKQKFGGPVIANGGYDLASAARALEQGHCDVVAFGKAFIANPDLVARLCSGSYLNECDTATFYGSGRKGYTDYPALGAGKSIDRKSTRLNSSH